MRHRLTCTMDAYRTLLKFIRFSLRLVLDCQGCLLRYRWASSFGSPGRSCLCGDFSMALERLLPCGWRSLQMRISVLQCRGLQLWNSSQPRQNFCTNLLFCPVTNRSPSLFLTLQHFLQLHLAISDSESLLLTLLCLLSFYFISGWL